MAKSNGLNFNLPSVDDLFSTEEERAEARLEKVVNLSPTEISDFPNHPFKVRMDAAMQEMTESVKQYGVLVPALVRPKPEGGYEMVAGHRRKKAADLAGLAKIPCIVRQLTDDEATIIMVDSNLQREQILPSEKAFAYKMKLDALKRQGQWTDLTSSPLDNKLKGVTAAQQISRDSGDSQPQIYRYIRLTHLIPEILELVDNSVLKDQEMLQIAMRPAVELSYLRKEEQADLFAIMDEMDCTPSHAQAIKMRQMSEAKTGGERLAKDALVSIMKEEKPNQKEQFKIPKEKISRFFAPGTPTQKIEDTIVNAGTLPQTPAQFREIAHSQGGSAPICRETAACAGSPSPHLTPSKQPKQPKKRRYLGSLDVYRKLRPLFHRQTSGCEENRAGLSFLDSNQHKPQHIGNGVLFCGHFKEVTR